MIWLLRAADFVVSVDSGPMHIAAAVDTKMLSIHTWSDPRLVGPFSDDAWIWQGGRNSAAANWGALVASRTTATWRRHRSRSPISSRSWSPSSDLRNSWRLLRLLFLWKRRKDLLFFAYPSNSSTIARSSFSSLTLASIFALAKSFRGIPWTISIFVPSDLVGNEQIRPFSIP